MMAASPTLNCRTEVINIVKSLIPTICLVYPFTMTQKGMINTKLDNKDMKMTAPPFRFRAAITSCRYRVYDESTASRDLFASDTFLSLLHIQAELGCVQKYAKYRMSKRGKPAHPNSAVPL